LVVEPGFNGIQFVGWYLVAAKGMHHHVKRRAAKGGAQYLVHQAYPFSFTRCPAGVFILQRQRFTTIVVESNFFTTIVVGAVILTFGQAESSVFAGRG
jgi:hypothetical protein